MADDVVLKLVLKGMDPGEAQKVAAMTGEQLESALKAVYANLEDLHKKAKQAQTKDEIAETQKQIKIEQSKGKEYERLLAQQVSAAKRASAAQAREAKRATDESNKESARQTREYVRAVNDQIAAIKRREREESIAANASSRQWRRLLEDMENITVITQGAAQAVGFFTAVPGKMAALQHEVIKTTKVYGSLKGSIDEMRTATGGTVSDMDLITTKNRAFEKSLKLTDEEFGLVAKAAQRFADSMGKDVSGAMEQAIDAFAGGEAGGLKQLGVVVDQEKAFKTYAKSIGLAVDKLDEQAKIEAVRRAGLEQLRNKMKDAGDATENFARQTERGFIAIENAWNSMLAGIGSSPLLASIGGAVASWAKDLEFILGMTDAKQGKAYLKYVEEKAGKDKDAAFDKARIESKRVALKYATSPRERKQIEEEYRTDEEKAAIKRIKSAGKGKGKEYSIEKYMSPSQGEHAKRMDQPLIDLIERTGGTGGVLLPDGTFVPMSDETVTRGIEHRFDAFGEVTPAAPTTNRARDNFAAMQERIGFTDQAKSAAGGGFVGQLAFGEDGVEKSLEDMDIYERGMVDMLAGIQQASNIVSQSIGDTLFAAVSGEGRGQPLSQIIKAGLTSLGQDAARKAVYYGLEAAALGIFGGPAAAPAAAKAGALAAAYGTFAATTGAAVRAMSAGSGTGAGAATGTPPVRRGGEFGSGSGRNSGSGARDDDDRMPPVNLYVWPGGEAEAGRAIEKFLQAQKQKKGRLDFQSGH